MFAKHLIQVATLTLVKLCSALKMHPTFPKLEAADGTYPTCCPHMDAGIKSARSILCAPIAL